MNEADILLNPDDRPLSPAELELVAGLVGTTRSQLKEVGKNIISPSGNLKGPTLDASGILREAASKVARVPAPAPPSQPVFPQNTPQPESAPMAQQPPPQPIQQMAMPQQVPSVVIMDTATVQQFTEQIAALGDRVTELTQIVYTLKSVEEKHVATLEKVLNKGIKTVTIKLNDTVDQKQEELR